MLDLSLALRNVVVDFVIHHEASEIYSGPTTLGLLYDVERNTVCEQAWASIR